MREELVEQFRGETLVLRGYGQCDPQVFLPKTCVTS